MDGGKVDKLLVNGMASQSASKASGRAWGTNVLS